MDGFSKYKNHSQQEKFVDLVQKFYFTYPLLLLIIILLILFLLIIIIIRSQGQDWQNKGKTVDVTIKRQESVKYVNSECIKQVQKKNFFFFF